MGCPKEKTCDLVKHLREEIVSLKADGSLLLAENYQLIEELNPVQYKKLKITDFFTTTFPRVE